MQDRLVNKEERPQLESFQENHIREKQIAIYFYLIHKFIYKKMPINRY